MVPKKVIFLVVARFHAVCQSLNFVGFCLVQQLVELVISPKFVIDILKYLDALDSES